VAAVPITSLSQLVEAVRTDLGSAPGRVTELVTRWCDAHPDDYVQGVLEAELGSHQTHFEVYRLLDLERRVAFCRRAVARCQSEGRSGLTAGSFMLGRFVSTPHPVAFWGQLDEAEVAFLLDEWSQYQGYLAVLDEVGERELRRARHVLQNRGRIDLPVTLSDAKLFMALKLSTCDLAAVAERARQAGHLGTMHLVETLRRPYRDFYDFALSWSVGMLAALCAEAARPLPSPDET
jgi:hypothetical protein